MTGTAAARPLLPAGSAVRPAADDDLTAYHLRHLVPYRPMWAQQQTLARARADDERGNLVLLLEHEPVYTIGTHGKAANLLIDAALLAERGITCHRVDRGGDITYHGPGQLVGYPIIRLRGSGRGVRAYVGALEAALIRTAASFGVAATRVPGHSGIWVGEDKLAAIGIRVRRGITYHGFALNVAPDLAPFHDIIPCGLPGKGVTSLAALLRRTVRVAEVVPICARAVADACGLRLTALTTLDAATLPGPQSDLAAGWSPRGR
jgi:lipoyl(octanoyl) transferase